MSHILNYAFVLVWSIFGEIHWKLLFLVKKVTLSVRSSEILRKFVFPKSLKRGIDQTSKRGQILTKSVFLLKVSHIEINYAFVLFWSIFGEIHWKLPFLVKKWLPQWEAQKYSESMFFPTSLKRRKSRRIFGFFKQMLLINPIKGDKY